MSCFNTCRKLRYLMSMLLHHFSSRKPKKATERIDEFLPVNKMPNIKLNTRICLSFMYIVCKKRLKSN